MDAKTTQVARNWVNKTDLVNRLSYSNGVKNMIGVKNTDQTIRLRITNNHSIARPVYIAPQLVLGLDVMAPPRDGENTFADVFGLPAGRHYATPDDDTIVTGVDPDEVTTTCTVASLNPNQNPVLIAGMNNTEPMQITELILRSFNATTGVPENGNMSNDIQHHRLDAFKKHPVEYLNLSDFQSSKDFNTDIMKVDLIKANFALPISQADIFAILVNPNTRLDITIKIGARDSLSERFFRDVKNGMDMLRQEFPAEFAKDTKTCGC